MSGKGCIILKAMGSQCRFFSAGERKECRGETGGKRVSRETIQGRGVCMWEVTTAKRGEDGGGTYRTHTPIGCTGERQKRGKEDDNVSGFFKLLI